MVGGLLLLHGLHPVSLEARVQQALDKVRPYLASHGGSVQLLSVSEEGGIRLRLEGSCHGCASSAMTLKFAIEQAIREGAPDAFAVEVEGVVEQPAQPTGFVPLTQIKGMSDPQSTSPAWQPVSGLDSLDSGRAGARGVGGANIAFCRVDGAWYAYADHCPRCRGSLDGAELQGPVLTCPGCGLRYDAQRAGRCLDATEHHLEPLPLLEEGGQVRVAAAAAVS
jgi:Fe-S cluster biogenesis protein NfuA/nitrite reductase/ring-hydroxylating ferredoxin subunit